MNRSASIALTLLACTLTVLSGQACADPVFLPLSVGRTWSYQTAAGGGETMIIAGTRDLMGAMVWVMDYTESTLNDSLESYWTIGADGDVLLHGFFRDEEGGWGMAYVPPITTVDVPVFIGKSWQCTTQTYRLPEEIPWDVLHMGFEVVWEGTLSVPAGTFSCIGVAVVPTVPSRTSRGYTLDGRRLTRDSDPSNWYSDGVGVVRYHADTMYELVSYGTSPVHPVSWTRIKALYHCMDSSATR